MAGASLSTCAMDSPMDAVAVIEKMCEVDPAVRYQSMDEILEDLSILGDT